MFEITTEFVAYSGLILLVRESFASKLPTSYYDSAIKLFTEVYLKYIVQGCTCLKFSSLLKGPGANTCATIFKKSEVKLPYSVLMKCSMICG